MNTKNEFTAVITTTLIWCTFTVFIFYFGLTTIEEEEGREKYERLNYNNNILIPIEVFAQKENNKLPVVKNSKIINFNGVNYADIVNSRDISLNSFTVSTW